MMELARLKMLMQNTSSCTRRSSTSGSTKLWRRGAGNLCDHLAMQEARLGYTFNAALAAACAFFRGRSCLRNCSDRLLPGMLSCGAGLLELQFCMS